MHTHTQTLSLLALQRVKPNLPLKLLSPDPTLLKHGSLYQAERGSTPMQREFLLFFLSDCHLWLAPHRISFFGLGLKLDRERHQS